MLACLSSNSQATHYKTPSAAESKRRIERIARPHQPMASCFKRLYGAKASQLQLQQLSGTVGTAWSRPVVVLVKGLGSFPRAASPGDPLHADCFKAKKKMHPCCGRAERRLVHPNYESSCKTKSADSDHHDELLALHCWSPDREEPRVGFRGLVGRNYLEAAQVDDAQLEIVDDGRAGWRRMEWDGMIPQPGRCTAKTQAHRGSDWLHSLGTWH